MAGSIIPLIYKIWRIILGNLEQFRVASDEHLDKTKVSIVLKSGAVLIWKASCTFLNLVSIFEKNIENNLLFSPQEIISGMIGWGDRTTNEDGIRYLFGTTGTKSKKLRGIEEPKRQIQSVSPGERIASSKHWMRGQGTLLEEPSQNSNLRRNKGKYEMTDEYEEE
ncbi:hypothetical protein PPACK8108_LOCUS21685 [Phakopsora pachyrhizi]|uniref:Uncharacterized protein n=1 Tax=Phakopsora pachyrhizi TaxID=170000 RepID=A0AAV0BKW8_PHAPC|nr:hypothetical protein PPACK8108_LOCUS21685 [Phakopsora pachyrhizi]